MLTGMAYGQAARYNGSATTVGNPVSGTLGPAGSLVPILGIVNAGINLCTVTTPVCQTPLITYTDATEVATCPSTAQLTRPNQVGCFSTADSEGNWGVWVAPGTTFQYMIAAHYGSSGPYWATAPGGSGGGGGGSFITEAPAGTINGSNRTFVLSQTPTTLWLEFNGVFQTAGIDYTISGQTITFTVAPASGTVDAIYETTSTLTFFTETPAGTINGTNTAFSISHSVGSTVWLELNGVFQTRGIDYTLTGTSITFANAPTTGSVLTIIYSSF